MSGEIAVCLGKLRYGCGHCGIAGEIAVWLEKLRYVWGNCGMSGEIAVCLGKLLYVWGNCAMSGEIAVYLGKLRYVWGNQLVSGKKKLTQSMTELRKEMCSFVLFCGYVLGAKQREESCCANSCGVGHTIPIVTGVMKCFWLI
jgi:hypothetical protein